GDQGELLATSEQRAVPAIGGQFLREPRVRNDREAQVHEIRRLMGEYTELIESVGTRAPAELFDDMPAEALPAALFADDERANLGASAAQRRELAAGDDGTPSINT